MFLLNTRHRLQGIMGIAVLVGVAASLFIKPDTDTTEKMLSFLLQGDDLSAVATAVHDIGGEITHELAVIRAVGALLDAEQVEQLSQHPSIHRIYKDYSLKIAASHQGEGDGDHWATMPYTHFPKLVRAHRLHKEGILGDGATLAVIDTGSYPHPNILWDSQLNSRVLAHYDAIEDRNRFTFGYSDLSGHGSHVAGISVNSSQKSDSIKYNGIAPNADLVVVKAFDEHGRATYADVIRGLDWVLANQDVYNIKVLNLSFSAEPRSHYWDDPLNQAVMAAWRAGITVVVAAGNRGPDPMTIGVPGNVPYVITVGAMTDAYSPRDGSDDHLASFSATGPTAEGFIKPELVAPGGHMESLVPFLSEIARNFPEFYGDGSYFTMSGTSQAAAVASGAALLMLAKDPHLTPDEVKCRLMASARTAIDDQGKIAYSPLQQGAGLLDAKAAAYSSASGCANVGLDIDLDLDGLKHYAGPVRLSEDGATFFIEGRGYDWSGAYTPQGQLWTGGNPWIDASLWSSGNPWIDASLWSSGNPWIDASGNPWIDASGNPWIDASLWWQTSREWTSALMEEASINQWVDQE